MPLKAPFRNKGRFQNKKKRTVEGRKKTPFRKKKGRQLKKKRAKKRRRKNMQERKKIKTFLIFIALQKEKIKKGSLKKRRAKRGAIKAPFLFLRARKKKKEGRLFLEVWFLGALLILYSLKGIWIFWILYTKVISGSNFEQKLEVLTTFFWLDF